MWSYVFHTSKMQWVFRIGKKCKNLYMWYVICLLKIQIYWNIFCLKCVIFLHTSYMTWFTLKSTNFYGIFNLFAYDTRITNRLHVCLLTATVLVLYSIRVASKANWYTVVNSVVSFLYVRHCKWHIMSYHGLLYIRTDFLPKEVAKIRPKIDKIRLHYHST